MANCRSPIADCRLPIADCQLPIANPRLAIANVCLWRCGESSQRRLSDLGAREALPFREQSPGTRKFPQPADWKVCDTKQTQDAEQTLANRQSAIGNRQLLSPPCPASLIQRSGRPCRFIFGRLCSLCWDASWAVFSTSAFTECRAG